jgi:hypothetical protein
VQWFWVEMQKIENNFSNYCNEIITHHHSQVMLIDNYFCAFVLSPQIWLVMLENQIVVYHTFALQVIIFLLHLWHRHLKV